MNTTSVAQDGIWSAVCQISMEFMDLKTKDDLKFVRVTEPIREREMAIHNGQVITSCLLNYWIAIPRYLASQAQRRCVRALCGHRD